MDDSGGEGLDDGWGKEDGIGRVGDGFARGAEAGWSRRRVVEGEVLDAGEERAVGEGEVVLDQAFLDGGNGGDDNGATGAETEEEYGPYRRRAEEGVMEGEGEERAGGDDGEGRGRWREGRRDWTVAGWRRRWRRRMVERVAKRMRRVL
ncbi:uncharacterized protein A4U43_C08F6290 [Asparagus officinalis]|nr:uncharacterized protein A4U43_C08F6290 [Asparagus officinalis]